MIRRTTICALIMFAVCAFFAVDKANAQAVYGRTAIIIDTTNRQLYGFHETEVDYVAWWYYEPAVEGFIYDEFGNERDFDSDVEEIGYVAHAETQITWQPGKTYYVISDHYVGLIIYEPPPSGGGPAYWNPFGFGFSGPGGYNPLWSFFPFAPPGYQTVRFIYLGSTGFEIIFFGEPHIDLISPTSAPVDTNLELHFEGTNLGGNPSVNISGSGITKGAIIFSTETRLSLNISIAANAPPGNRSVSISTRGYTSNSVTFHVGDRTPHIDSINPSRGNAGSSLGVTLTGTNFGLNPILIISGGITGTVTSSTNTQINSQFTIPSGTLAGDYDVRVFSNGISGTGFISPGSGSATSNAVTFTVNATAAPRINDYSPKSGQLGTTIEINVIGQNFGTSRTLVIGGQGVTVQSYTSVSDPDHQIVATLNIAENAETGDHSIRVSAGGQLSNSVNFLVGNASPVITSIVPPFGVAGTTVNVTITGRGFGTDPTVTVTGNDVNVTVNQKSDTNIQATFQISSLAVAVPRLVTVTSRGTNGNSFIQTPGANQSTSVPFDIKKAKVKIDSMDARFAPGAERLNITYSITPVGTVAPFARLQIFKKGDKNNPIFVDNNIPKTGTVQYSQNGNSGWDGKDSNGNFIGPDGSPYNVVISIDDNAGFTNNKTASRTFKIEMFVETAIAQAAPVLPTPTPTPGKHDKEYNIIKPWRSIATEINTQVTFKILYLSKDGQTKIPTPIPYKVDWSFKDIDDTSSDPLADTTGSNVGDDNATVAEGGKRGGPDDMWKAVTNFPATINPGGQTATSDVAVVSPDIGTTKISFLSSAIGGDNYQIIATIREGTVVAKTIEFKKWSVRKNLDFNQAFQVAEGTDLRNFVSESIVEGAFNGEGYTDYHFNTNSIQQVAKPNNSEYLIELLQPTPAASPSPELPSQTELNDYNNGTAAQKLAAKNAITAKAQAWYERNVLEIQSKLTAFLTSLHATSDAIVGANLYHLKHNGRNDGKTDFYPSGIVIEEKTIGPNNTLVATGVTFDPDELWKAKIGGNPAPVQGFETSLGQTRYAFVFSNVPNQPRKQIVGRHEIGHASDHVLFGPANEPNPLERDHWTSGLMHKTGQSADFAPDSIVRLRGRKR